MSLKSAWASKNGGAILNESIRERDEMEADRKHDAFARKALNEPARLAAKEKALLSLGATFDGLKVGDSLAAFDIPNAIVEKKNKKSVLTFMCKYTKKELVGA